MTGTTLTVNEAALASSRRAARFRKNILPWLFMAPSIFFNVLVILGPSFGSAYYAFTDWSGLGVAKWVGLANFQRMVTDRVYLTAPGNNLKWTAIFLTVPISLALFGSALLAPIKRFASAIITGGCAWWATSTWDQRSPGGHRRKCAVKCASTSVTWVLAVGIVSDLRTA